MPNYFHMGLMRVQAERLSKGMQWLMTSNERRYHRHYGTSGHIGMGVLRVLLYKKTIIFSVPFFYEKK